MKRIKVRCGQAKLTAPAWMENLWPEDMPPERFPTFCGAGDGLGDRIVPDKIQGKSISPSCFLHDVGWATSADTIWSFMAENWYLAMNNRALILASDLPWWRKELGVFESWTLFFPAVSTIGAFAFDPRSRDDESPLDNPIVKARLKRLAYADLGLADIITQNGGHEENPTRTNTGSIKQFRDLIAGIENAVDKMEKRNVAS